MREENKVREAGILRHSVPRKGKTASVLTDAEKAVCRGGLVFVDLRADKKVPRTLSAYAQKHNRKFYHWTIRGLSNSTPAYYNSLKRLGFASRRPVPNFVFSDLTRDGAVSVFTIAPSLNNTEAGLALDSVLTNLLAEFPHLENDSAADWVSIIVDEHRLSLDMDSLVNAGRSHGS